MAGQGSLRQTDCRYRDGLLARVGRCAFGIAILGYLMGALPALGQSGDSSPSIDIRIRMEFRSPSPQPWQLRLTLTDPELGSGGFSEIRNHSESRATSGSYDLDPSRKVLAFGCRHPIRGGSFVFRIRGSRDSKLRIESLGGTKSTSSMPRDREIALVDLLELQPIESQELGEDVSTSASWTIQRAESDHLRLENLRRVPVYESGTDAGLAIRTAAMIGQTSQSCVLVYELCRVGDGAIVQSHRWPIQIDSQGNSQVIELNDPLPEADGVYEIRVQVEPEEDNLWSRFRRRPPALARLTHPIVILSAPSESENESLPDAWREIGVIRPSESTWSVGEWLPESTTRLIPGGSIPTVERLESETYAEQSVSLLQASGTFQATLPVAKKGYPHKVTIRLPASVKTNLLVQLGKDRKDASTEFVLERDATADQEGPWREHTFIHYPIDEDQIWLTNMSSTSTTAFESITVHAGPPHLSSTAPLPSGRRTAALNLSDMDWVNTISSDCMTSADTSDCARSTIALYRLWTAAQRIGDYAIAGGFNAIVIPANHRSQSWYESSHFALPDSDDAPHSHYLETLLHLLQSTQLDIYVRFKPDMLLTDMERSIRNREALLVELTRSETTGMRSTADQVDSQTVSVRTQYNPLHPLTQDAIAELVVELVHLCSQYQAWAGIIVDCGDGSHLDPLQNPDSDLGALILFGRDNNFTGNFAELRNWMQQQSPEAFSNWQTQRMRQAYASVSESGGEKLARLLVPAISPVDLERPSTETSADARIATLLRDLSQSSAITTSFRYGPLNVLAKEFRMQSQLATTDGPLPGILIGEERTEAAPYVVRETFMGDVSRMIHRADPKFVMIDNSLIGSGLHTGLTETLRSFCSLPVHSLQESIPVDSASHTVRLRSCIDQGHLYISMINVVPWNCDVDLELSVPTQWEVLGRHTTDDHRWIDTTGGVRTRVSIPSQQMVVLRSKEPTTASIRSWTTRVSDGPEAIESIKRKVTLVVERIGILNNFKPYESLTNGGFEQSGGMGLVGWLHAQHPPGCVQIVNGESIEGSHSVMLTTSTPSVSRTWLVSEMIEPPVSGRLAVSLACRAAEKSDRSPHVIRVSMEATQQGTPIRFARDIEIPRDGQWSQRRVILEVDEIDSDLFDSLRLTIDSLSTGRVWIDDVQLHDRFPTATERADLERQAFLAMQGLQRGNLLPSGRLLQNVWARYLLMLGPGEQSKRVIETVPVPEETPGVAERIRSWLPRPLRF